MAPSDVGARFFVAFPVLSLSRSWRCSARVSWYARPSLSLSWTLFSSPILMIPQSLFVCLCLSLCHHLCAYASLSLLVSPLRYLPTRHFFSFLRGSFLLCAS